MERRQFIGACSGALLCSPIAAPNLMAADAKPRAYERVRLLDEHGKPLRASALPKRSNLVFSYPYVATPAFLLDLGKPATPTGGLPAGNGGSYAWPGGVGPGRSIVAFAAICAHQLAYPTREISFISYREKAGGANRRGEVIHCCAEHSQYDPGWSPPARSAARSTTPSSPSTTSASRWSTAVASGRWCRAKPGCCRSSRCAASR
jgi:arsenite oxidase small subunit